jgi:cell division septum initiation protein DivIVA
MTAFTVSRKFDIQRPTRQTVKKDKNTHIQRISRLMALAIELDRVVKRNRQLDYAELARKAKLSRARMTQIMNLNLLAPSIQERLLFLPETDRGRDDITLRELQKVALEPDWGRQRAVFDKLL